VGEFAILRDLVVIFAVAVCVVALLRRLGIPSIAGFILAGVIVGPGALAWVDDPHQVERLAEVGVALLLFGIGLELDLARLRRLWAPVLLGGTIQVSLTVGASAALGVLYGLSVPGSIFLGFVIAPSSTAIVLRGLEARGEVDAPHGRLTLGILVFQDLSVVPMMLVLPVLAGADTPASTIAIALLKTVAVVAGILVSAWVLVPRLLHWIAVTRQRDLFVLIVFLVSIGTAWVVSKAGVSLALGAFLAGLVVAGSEYRHQALSDLIPFREVFASLFFVSVGMLLEPLSLWPNSPHILRLLAAILVGKFLIVFLTGTLLGLPGQVNFLAALALCQVGEFSFVLLQAADPHLLNERLVATFLVVAIISMLITPLALAVGPRLAAGAGKLRVFSPLLGVPAAGEAKAASQGWRDHVLIAGYGVAGQELARSLEECGIRYVIVDLNPDNARRARRRGEPAYFGDVTSVEVLEHLGAAHAREVVLLINDPGAAERAIAAVRRVNPTVHIVVRSRYLADLEPLAAVGATKVVPAELEAAVEVAAHVLGRHGVDPERTRSQIARIRSRRSEEAPAGDDAAGDAAPA